MWPARYVCAARNIIKTTQIIKNFSSIKGLLVSNCDFFVKCGPHMKLSLRPLPYSIIIYTKYNQIIRIIYVFRYILIYYRSHTSTYSLLNCFYTSSPSFRPRTSWSTSPEFPRCSTNSSKIQTFTTLSAFTAVLTSSQQPSLSGSYHWWGNFS